MYLLDALQQHLFPNGRSADPQAEQQLSATTLATAVRDSCASMATRQPDARLLQSAEKPLTPPCLGVDQNVHPQQTPIHVEQHSAGQHQETIDMQCCLLQQETIGLDVVSSLHPQNLHQPSSISQMQLSAHIQALPPKLHRARLDLETNLRCSSRATLEGSWQLSRKAVGSLTLGTDLKHGGAAKGAALEYQPNHGSKAFIRCLTEPAFGVQWLASWHCAVSPQYRLEAEGFWHKPGTAAAAAGQQEGWSTTGRVVQANNCNLSLRLVCSAKAKQGMQLLGERVQPNGTAGSGWVADPEQQQWSVTLTLDPRAATLWALHAQLH